MLTTVLTALTAVAALLSPAAVYGVARMRARRAELIELHDRLDQRDATIVALWDYVWDLRYWIVKGGPGECPTMPDSLTVAAVRARLNA